MTHGKAFEMLIRHILVDVGFSEVSSDGLYIFDGPAGQMIQGLGEAHNADVLLDPPVQTPFYFKTRLLVECKNYTRKVGLHTVRSVLGLREDINHFDMVDMHELVARRTQNRRGVVSQVERYSYQVAIAATNGYTTQAQKFAATHRIPLIELTKMPFWGEFRLLLQGPDVNEIQRDYRRTAYRQDAEADTRIEELANEVGKKMAVAITNSGQLLFLYRIRGIRTHFKDLYSLHWTDIHKPWRLDSGECSYLFQLPDSILKQWLEHASNELDTKKSAINCKASFFSNMVVYYVEHYQPRIHMISIDRYALEDARKQLDR